MLTKNSKIFIAGHKGMVGSAVERLLIKEGFRNLIVRTRSQLNLLDNLAVKNFFTTEKPEYMILAAAKVGGIKANMQAPVQFLNENLIIQTNLINEAHLAGIEKIVFLGSSCIYPRDCPQPMKEEYLLTGKLEPTNEGYAIAKIAGLKSLEYYSRQYNLKSISLMPCNLYGTNDSFDLEKSHVLSALVRKFVDAVDDGLGVVDVWGSGSARREFMHVDDLAEGVLYFMEHSDFPHFINIGWGFDVSIKELATLISEKAGYTGEIRWDISKPEGMPRKCLYVDLMKKEGFEPSITLENGVMQTIEEYRFLKLNNKV